MEMEMEVITGFEGEEGRKSRGGMNFSRDEYYGELWSSVSGGCFFWLSKHVVNLDLGARRWEVSLILKL
jgi:hypothetical protein